MLSASTQIPIVLTFSEMDPTGGAGLAGDIEAIASVGCHAAPVVTAITVQDTRAVKSYRPLPATDLIEQARAILEDLPVASFKVGLLDSVTAIETVHTIMADYPSIPVVVDPARPLTAERVDGDHELLDAMVSLIFPNTTVVIPNSYEARWLAPEADSLDACAQQLLSYGCEFVLVTAAREATPQIINTLYTDRRQVKTFSWSRLPEDFHGAGATLAASLAGLLAQGGEPYSAIYEAQHFTWNSLSSGYRLGCGQHLPNRLFWAGSRQSGKL